MSFFKMWFCFWGVLEYFPWLIVQKTHYVTYILHIFYIFIVLFPVCLKHSDTSRLLRNTLTGQAGQSVVIGRLLRACVWKYTGWDLQARWKKLSVWKLYNLCRFHCMLRAFDSHGAFTGAPLHRFKIQQDRVT